MSVAPLPKRLETILTSSGWEVRSAIELLSSTLAILLDHRVHLLIGQILVKVVIHLNGRRPTASADTLNFLQRKNAVGRSLFVPDSQFLFAVFQNLFSAPQHAGDVGAYLYVILANRLGVQHGVVADHVANFQLGQLRFLRQMSNHVVADVANLILAVEKHGNQE